MKRILILSITLLLYFFSYADNASDVRFKGFKFTTDGIHVLTIDIQTRQLKSEDLAGKITVLGELKTDADIFKDLPRYFNTNYFDHQRKIVFTIQGTGQVYELDLKTFLFERKDQTYFRGYNFWAAQFFRKDTLFSIGGSGFWMQNGLITYFNKSNKEWDLYQVKNESPMSVNARLSGYLKNKDLFFTANNFGEKVSNQRFFVHFFDFKNRIWNKKGILTKQIQDYIIKHEYNYLWNGRYGIFYRDETLIVDPIKNELFKLNSNISLDDFTPGNTTTFPRNSHKIYIRKFNSDTNGPKFKVDSFTVEDLIKKSTYLGKFYDDDTATKSSYYDWMIILIIILGIVIYSIFIKWKQNKVIFDDLDKRLIKALMEKSKGEFLSSNEINDLLNIDDKSYDNQRKIRSKRIIALNVKLHQIFNETEVIKKILDVYDKRISNYYIDQEDKVKRLQQIIK